MRTDELELFPGEIGSRAAVCHIRTGGPEGASLSSCSISPILVQGIEQGGRNLPTLHHSGMFDELDTMNAHRTDELQAWLPRLAEAGLAGDRQQLELLVIDVIRTLKRPHPAVSKELGRVLASYSANPGSLRWKEAGPPPVDGDEGMALLQIEQVREAPCPILSPEITEQVEQFLSERQAVAHLLEEGISPPSSLLLTGLPGTGKSMLARWLAGKLNLPFAVQDLATSISSFLGKTGFNLRRTLDYARSRPCVLLLDEFDALAKRRDDQTEVGELKRIVNVLLKELERWPLHSVLIAATNHPALLDPAVRRRFNVVLDLSLPGQKEREEILERGAGRFREDFAPGLLEACAAVLEGKSGSDLESTMQAAVRKHLVRGVPVSRAVVDDVCRQLGGASSGRSIGQLIRAVKGASNGKLTVRDLASLFDKSVSTVQHHLSKESIDG